MVPLLLKVVELDESDELELQNLQQAVHAKLKDHTNAAKINKKHKALRHLLE